MVENLVVYTSHGIGIRKYVEPLALASIMAGADGIIYELHKTPDEAASDGYQSVNFFESKELIRKMLKVFETRKQLYQANGKKGYPVWIAFAFINNKFYLKSENGLMETGSI